MKMTKKSKRIFLYSLTLSMIIVVVLTLVLSFSLAALPKLTIVKSGVVFEGGYNAWPDVARLDNGKIAVVWSGNRINGHYSAPGEIFFSTADEKDMVFSTPIKIGLTGTGADYRDSGICYVGGGRIIVTSYQTEYWENGNPRKTHTFYLISDDYGATWSDIKEIPILAPHGIKFAPNENGEGGTVYYIGKKHVEFSADGNPLSNDAQILCYASINGGDTWDLRGEVFPPTTQKWHAKDWEEPTLAVLPDGTLLAAIRFWNASEKKGYIKNSMYTTYSYDGGVTWTPLKRIRDVVGCPPNLLVHSSGVVINSYARRPKPNPSVRTMFSTDEGKTWSKEYSMVNGQTHWDFGYPCSVELDNGDIFTVYYDMNTKQRNPKTSERNIYFAVWQLPKLSKI